MTVSELPPAPHGQHGQYGQHSRGGRGLAGVVAEREMKDTWWGGRALSLMLAFSLLLSATTYLVAVNQALNFLEQRESAGLTLQIAVAVGGLLALLGAADAVSGERERGTLESLLLSPAPRRAVVLGKGASAMSLWLGAFALSLPYIWYLGRDVDAFWTAASSGLLVGTLLSLFLVGFGLVLSIFSRSNRLSLAVALFALLALYTPTQMPSQAQQGWAGDLLLHVDPFTSGLRYLDRVIVSGHSGLDELGWLVGPVIAAALGVSAALLAGSRLELLTGDHG